MSSNPATPGSGSRQEDSGSRVEEVLRTHPQARIVLGQIGKAARGSESSVDELEATFKGTQVQVGRREIVDVFKALDAANAGRFIVGRRTKPSRFRWGMDWSGLAKDVDAGAGVDSGGRDPGIDGDREEVRLVEHRYRLRPSYEVLLMLPTDLSKLEASRLADFVKTLPFE